MQEVSSFPKEIFYIKLAKFYQKKKFVRPPDKRTIWLSQVVLIWTTVECQWGLTGQNLPAIAGYDGQGPRVKQSSHQSAIDWARNPGFILNNFQSEIIWDNQRRSVGQYHPAIEGNGGLRPGKCWKYPTGVGGFPMFVVIGLLSVTCLWSRH